MDVSEADALLASYRADPYVWLAGSGIVAIAEQEVMATEILSAKPALRLKVLARSVVEVARAASYLEAVVYPAHCL